MQPCCPLHPTLRIQPNILESGLSSTVYFYLYSRLRNLAVAQKNQSGSASSESKGQDIDVVSSLLVAALAGAGNQLLTMPASVVATRMQAQSKLCVERGGQTAGPEGGDVWSIARVIFAESGLAGFWAGLLPALVLVVNPAVQFMLYEQLLRLIRQLKTARQKLSADKDLPRAGAGGDASPVGEEGPAGSQLSAWEVFWASAVAKIGATGGWGTKRLILHLDCRLITVPPPVVTYPMIVVKSRMQAASKSAGRTSSTLGIIGTVWREGGLLGFFQGLKAKILQAALNAALMLMLKEQLSSATQRLLMSRRRGRTFLL